MRFHSHTRIARTAALGVTVCAAVALFAGTALSAGASDKIKAKMAGGHWTGGGEQHWQSGPDKKYKTNAQLTDAVKAKRANGYWAGGGEMYWVPGSK